MSGGRRCRLPPPTARKHRGDAVPSSPSSPRRKENHGVARPRFGGNAAVSHVWSSEASRSRRCGTGVATAAAADLGLCPELTAPLRKEGENLS